MKHCKKIMSVFLTAILLTVLAACSNGSNGDSSDNEKNGNSVVCTYVQEYDESNYYIFYADGTVEGYLNGKLEYPRSTLKYEGTPTSEGTVNVKVNTGAILLILTVMKNGDSIIAKDNFGMSYTVKGNSGENSDGKEKEGGDDNNSGTLCTWHMDGDESTYFIFYADGLIEYYEKGKVQYEKGMLKYSGTPTENGIVTIEENTGVILFNFKVSNTWAYQLNSETRDIEAKYIIKTGGSESDGKTDEGDNDGSEDNTTGSDSSGDDETPSKKMFMGFDNVVTIENGTDMVGITNTIYSLTSDTTLKFKGGINAITLTTIAAAIGTNDSVKIALDFSETTGITEWTNKLAGQKTLYAISLPNTVTSVADGAFDECTKLKAITVPKSITEFPSEIPSDTIINFQGTIWEWLKISIIFPDGQTLYLNGKELMSAESGFILPKGITSIPDNAFEGCTWLSSITIPDGVTEIGAYAFKGCSSLTSVTIHNSVTTIGGYAFYGCKNLTNITLPDSITEINYYIFSNSGLTNITIPNGVTRIGRSAFRFCENLQNVTISDGVMTIGEEAFYGCSSLTSITIPASVTNLGYHIFENCLNLATIYYEGTSEQWLRVQSDIDTYNYSGDFYINGENVKNINSVIIPDSITSINTYAFSNWENLTNVTIPNSVTTIGQYAFYGCKSLTDITLPDSITEIYFRTFSHSGLTNIVIPNNVTSIDFSAFEYCENLQNVTISDGVMTIGEEAFYECSSLASITIPDSVTSIGEYAFRHCLALTTITIPNSVTSIGDRAFMGCYGLTNITLPDSLTSIGENTFNGCIDLTSVTIPTTITSIGDGAFSVCPSLTTINYRGTETQWNAITIGNDAIPTSATIVYNYTGD